jgi:hypothetical protein
VIYSPTHSTLSTAKAAGFDLNGLNADPLFVATPSATNGYSLAVKTGSVATTLGIAATADRLPPASPTGVVAR